MCDNRLKIFDYLLLFFNNELSHSKKIKL
jgi:hypothetical protein